MFYSNHLENFYDYRKYLNNSILDLILSYIYIQTTLLLFMIYTCISYYEKLSYQ
jgi:Ca2+-dependent lipid-binding protein